MSDQPTAKPTTSRSITFHRPGYQGRPYIHATATTRSENPDSPVEIVRPYGDGSGDEVLVSLTADEWADLIAFVEVHGKVARRGAKL